MAGSPVAQQTLGAFGRKNSGRRVNSSLCFVQLTLQWSQGSVLLSSAGMNIALTNTGVLAVR